MYRLSEKNPRAVIQQSFLQLTCFNMLVSNPLLVNPHPVQGLKTRFFSCSAITHLTGLSAIIGKNNGTHDEGEMAGMPVGRNVDFQGLILKGCFSLAFKNAIRQRSRPGHFGWFNNPCGYSLLLFSLRLMDVSFKITDLIFPYLARKHKATDDDAKTQIVCQKKPLHQPSRRMSPSQICLRE